MNCGGWGWAGGDREPCTTHLSVPGSDPPHSGSYRRLSSRWAGIGPGSPGCAADWCTSMARNSPEGNQERPSPPTSALTLVALSPSTQFLRRETTVVWSAPGTEWPSLTTSALLRCTDGAWGLGEVLLLPHHRAGTKAPTCPLQFPTNRA